MLYAWTHAILAGCRNHYERKGFRMRTKQVFAHGRPYIVCELRHTKIGYFQRMVSVACRNQFPHLAHGGGGHTIALCLPIATSIFIEQSTNQRENGKNVSSDLQIKLLQNILYLQIQQKFTRKRRSNNYNQATAMDQIQEPCRRRCALSRPSSLSSSRSSFSTALPPFAPLPLSLPAAATIVLLPSSQIWQRESQSGKGRGVEWNEGAL